MAAIAAALLVMATAGGLAVSADAATYTVGTTNDLAGTCANPASGLCSLRQLIGYENSLAATPNPPDAIVVPAGTYNLTKGELKITQSLAIVGAGARTASVHEESPERVFKIEVPKEGSAPTVVISGLEISGGTANLSNGSFGGDVYNAGRLVLQEDWITAGNAESGGGISNDTGTLALERSLVSFNHASGGGGDSGGIQNHGSAVCVFNEELEEEVCSPGKRASLDVEDSTIANNDARLGGGIFSWSDEGVADGNQVSIINSTIAENIVKEEIGGPAREPAAGGLLMSEGTADVAGSILALNSATISGVFKNSNCTSGPGTIVSLGYNLANTTDCGFTATGDLQETFPAFSSSEPQNNGGNTDTLALEPTSPAVDAIPTSYPLCGGADQRGVTRPQGAGCDVGAVELVPFTIGATEGSIFSGKLATSGCSISGGAPTIDWGDGQQSNATVQESAVMSGSHTYAEEGIYNGSVSYEDDCGKHKVAFQAKVADAPLSPAGVPVSATAEIQLSAAVATFTDADPAGVASDYTATIAWGDGTTTAGTIGSAPGGGFAVAGSHTYAAGGVYPTTVTITDVGGATATATSTANVANPPPGPPILAPLPPTVVTSTSAAFTATVNPRGLATSVHFEYGAVLGGGAAAITYNSATPNQSLGPDYANHTVTATVTGLLPNITYHVRAVATNSAGTAQGADQILVTPADPPPPPPVLGKSANVAPVSGIVYVELPPGAKLASLSSLSSLAPATGALAALAKGQNFIPLTEARQIPVGSILNTSAGVARITTATASKGKLQSGDFGAGIFKLLQSRKQKGLTELDLMHAHSARQVCATTGKKKAVVAKHLSSKVLGRLNVNSHGKFTTRGQYSASTVRGTVWSVSDQCNGTLTKVIRGKVSVRDFRLRKTITLFTGQSYLAKAP